MRPHLPRNVAPIALIAWLAACGGDEPAPAGPPPALVEVAEARAGDLLDTWTLLGDVEAGARAELAAGAAGPVGAVRVREGDHVVTGALLVEVDPSLASAKYASAKASAEAGEAELTQARRDLERLSKVDRNVMAASEIEKAQSAVATLEARQAGLDATARQAAVELDRHRVKAPFDAVVAARHVDPGDWVTVGQPVVDVVSLGEVQVHVHAPLALAGQVEVGDHVTISASPPADGVVTGVVPALDPVERTALVRVVPVADTSLVPGMPVDVSFAVRRDDEGAVLVPRDALVLGPVDQRVVIVEDGAARVVTVEVLGRSGDTALVKGDGLVAGADVVVRGNERLAPGQPVQVTGRRGWTAED